MKTIVVKILIVVSLTGTQVLGYPPQERLTPGMRAIHLFLFLFLSAIFLNRYILGMKT